MNITHATEDYLKTIHALSANNENVSTNALAKQLQITPASVTGMLKRLAANEPALVHYRKHRGVTLTNDGHRAALRVIRQHRLLETYLHEALGFSWDEIHEEACRLEHAVSERLINRIDDALGYPTHDPHGDPIPDEDLRMPQKASVRLSSLRPQTQASIERVDTQDAALLRFLEEKDLVPGTKLVLRAYSPFDENLTVEVNGQEIVLGVAVTRHIFIKILS